jgi:OCT family organic cation transporter-like MFS transporter 4/5
MKLALEPLLRSPRFLPGLTIHLSPYFPFSRIAVSTSFYGLALNSGNLSGNLYVNFLITCLIEIPAYLFALLAPYKFGRKKPHAFCMIVGGIALVASIFVVLFGNDGKGSLDLILAALELLTRD